MHCIDGQSRGQIIIGLVINDIQALSRRNYDEITRNLFRIGDDEIRIQIENRNEMWEKEKTFSLLRSMSSSLYARQEIRSMHEIRSMQEIWLMLLLEASAMSIVLTGRLTTEDEI